MILKKILFFDVVQPSSLEFHKDLGAGSLSIEISAFGEKIITNPSVSIDQQQYEMRYIKTEGSGTVLPTVGIMIEF
mgnify:CR=1 FL=1